MFKVGFIGWRGMVGSVLMARMHEENDFKRFNPVFFSTSQKGMLGPLGATLKDAYDTNELLKLDCILTTQGSAYTNKILPQLRSAGYTGYWIDASSTLRMSDDTIIAFDPVNLNQILTGLNNGVKNFAGGNCSITLSLLGLSGLLKEDLVNWMSIMTYQSASGAGADNVRELLSQMSAISNNNAKQIAEPNTPILDLINNVKTTISSNHLPTKAFGVPLAGSVIPWIDADLGTGQSKEEWKGEVETNKILGLAPQTIRVDGLCVRVGSIQSHCAAITLKLKENISIKNLEQKIITGNEWVNYIPNTKEDSISRLTPAAVSGTLKVAVGRLRKLNLEENIYTVFTVGDQLLWGAAEPLRRVLNIIIEHNS